MELLKPTSRALNSRKRRSKGQAEKYVLEEAVVDETKLLCPSPIRSLPVEILSEIFLWYHVCAQPTPDCVQAAVIALRSIHLPILLTCRRWYTTALDDPRLWTTISFTTHWQDHPLLSPHSSRRLQFVDDLKRHIARSKMLPIHLVIHIDSLCEREHPMPSGRRSVASVQFKDSLFRCLDILFQLLPRAHTLWIDAGIPVLLGDQDKSFLETLDVPPASNAHAISLNAGDILGPKLINSMRRVEFLRMGLTSHCTVLPHVCKRLTSFDIRSSSISLTSALEIIGKLPLLHTLKLPSHLGSGSVTTRVMHPGISELHLEVMTMHHLQSRQRRHCCPDILKYISLPALSTFDITLDCHAQWPDKESIAFLAPSACTLDTLIVRGAIITDSVVPILKGQSMLTCVAFDRAPFHRWYKMGRSNKSPSIVSVTTSLINKLATTGTTVLLPGLINLGIPVNMRQRSAAERLAYARLKESELPRLDKLTVLITSSSKGSVSKKQCKAASEALKALGVECSGGSREQ